MRIDDIHNIYPISWICESARVREFIRGASSRSDTEFLVADFASGEHDRVPSFFVTLMSRLFDISEAFAESIYVYCIDIHALRLDSLMGNLEESEILNRVRVVLAKLEKMDEHAALRPAMVEYLKQNPNDLIWLDDFLIGENRFPPECFDIGILNNDIIGYMIEYYTEYSNAIEGLQRIQKLIKKDGLLIVTNPCSLYIVDNVTFLRDIGFEFVEGIDIDLDSGLICPIKANQDPSTLSRLGHYTFLIFQPKKTSNGSTSQ